MFGSIATRVPYDKDLPERAWRIEVLRRVLDGTLYDILPHPFHDERKVGGEYIPDRAPARGVGAVLPSSVGCAFRLP